MRLTCPNCGAQYEVPDEVIPAEGRDVQCSNCGDTWFQAHPDYPDAAHAPEIGQTETEISRGEEEIEASADVGEPEWEDGDSAEWAEDLRGDGDTPATDASSYREAAQTADKARELSVLREEAAREARLRAEEVGGLESQPDLGLDSATNDDGAKREQEAQERMARMRGEQPATAKVASDAGSRRGLLPDIEEINSTLRASSDGARGTALGPLREAFEQPVEEEKKSGFMRGFAIAILIGAGLAVLYSKSQVISQSVPQAAPALEAYVSVVDQGRMWLEMQANTLLQQN